MKKIRALITGATGHVGNNLARALIKEGASVTLMTHNPQNIGSVLDIDAPTVRGDILDAQSLVNPFKRADIVFHCAALIALDSSQNDKLFRVNTSGTRNVIDACSYSNVRRLVYLSSIEAFGLPEAGKSLDESTGFRPEAALLPYGKSKAEASLLVLDAVKRGLDAVIVCPTGVTGPNDFGPSLFGNMLIKFLKGRMPFCPGGAFDFVDVRDIASGIISAAGRGKSGETYILSGEYFSVQQILAEAAAALGKNKFCFKLPWAVLESAAFVADSIASLSGLSVGFSGRMLEVLKNGFTVDGSKAASKLGFKARPLSESIRDQVMFFLERGMV